MGKELSRIPGYGNRYILTSTGVVFTSHNNVFKPLKTQIINSGYELVHLRSANVRKAHTMHRLIATIFIPNPLNKQFVNHKDGNKLNNDSENLEWVTAEENMKHAHLNGLAVRKGVKNSRAKLKDFDVVKIKEMILSGLSNKLIGQKFGVDPSGISLIRNGKGWAHIK